MPQQFFSVKVEDFFAKKQDPIDNHNFCLQCAIEDKNNERYVIYVNCHLWKKKQISYFYRVNELPSSEINYGQEEYSDVGILKTNILQFLTLVKLLTVFAFFFK
jgi:hypothetical protein